MGRGESLRRLSHGVRLYASLAPDDTTGTSMNSTDFINITVAGSSSGVSSDSNNSSSNTGLHQFVTAIGAIIGFVVIVAMCFCMKPQHTAEAERRIRRYKRGYKKKTPSYYRSKRIEKALIVQEVVKVDKSGQVQLRDVDATDNKENDAEEEEEEEADDVSNTSSAAQGDDVNDSLSAASATNSENLVACCCICLEPYREGDIVAWNNSSDEACLHVFHRDCIRMWLTNPKHNECPSCRTDLLNSVPPDAASIYSGDDEDDDIERQRRTDSNNAEGDDIGLNSIHNNSTSSVVYYILHGLISRANQVNFTLIGQSISFDSEDSDMDGLYHTNPLRQNIVDDAIRPDWLNGPSTFRRALSFSDRIFSSTFSSAVKKQPPRGSWHQVSSSEESDENEAGMSRRASTKVIVNLKSLQQGHLLRRVVSAGPCTPLKIPPLGLDDPIRYLTTVEGGDTESYVDTTTTETFTVPFRRTLSLRQSTFSRETLSDCDEDEKPQIVKDQAIDDVEDSFDSTDHTEEDEIIIRKGLKCE